MDAQKWIVLTLILFRFTWITAQNGFLVDDKNGLFRVTGNCQTTFLFTLTGTGTISDLTLDPEGNLYGISTVGDLYQIDTVSQQTVRIHSFLYLQDFYALTCAIDGTFFVCGSEGYLYSYVVKGDREHFYGNMGLKVTGDLVVFHGYLVGSTDKGELVQMDLLRSQRARVIAKLPHRSAGLMIEANLGEPCPTGALLSVGQDGKMYQFMEATSSFTAYCDVMIHVNGVAGKEDFYDPDALLQSQVMLTDANCRDEEASIFLRWRAQQEMLTWSVDGQVHGHDSLAGPLASGRYLMTTTDARGCQDTLTVEVLKVSGPVIASVEVQNAPCLTGSGSLQVITSSGGIAGFRMDDQELQPSSQFSDVTPGIHYVWVVDSAGCQTQDTVEITFASAESLFSYQVTPATCDEANGAVLLSPVVPQIRFELDGAMIPVVNSKMILAAGQYTLRGIDTSGCQQEVQIAIPDNGCEIFIPTAFSPNQDGVNDVFQAYYRNQQEVMVQAYQIFDRWGTLLYSDGGFSIHGDDHWWNGTRKGQIMSPGVYIYRMVLVNEQGRQEVKQGTVTLLK